MSKAPAQRLPVALIAMNLLGSALFALGLVKAVGIGLPLDGFLPQGYHIVLIAAGVLLEIPLIRHLFDRARHGERRKGPGET